MAQSAIEALLMAHAGGQRIYHITSANQAAVLPLLGHSAPAEAEIIAALGAGNEVITHGNPISIPGWTGSGYVIVDTRHRRVALPYVQPPTDDPTNRSTVLAGDHETSDPCVTL